MISEKRHFHNAIKHTTCHVTIDRVSHTVNKNNNWISMDNFIAEQS